MDNKLKLRCYNNAYNLFGRDLPKIVESRLSCELELIIKNGYTSQYFNAQRIVKYSENSGYPALSSGAEGSSFVAYLLGITPIDPLPPHYCCPKCQRNEFISDSSAKSGFDLPPKTCPDCGEKMARSGHDISYETFLGIDGEKPPYFVFYISDKILDRVRSYTIELLGEEPPIKFTEIYSTAPSVLGRLAKSTGVDLSEITNVSADDPTVYKLLTSTEPLKLSEDIGVQCGTLGIEVFSSDHAMQVLIKEQPKSFSDLVKTAVLRYGTYPPINNTKPSIPKARAVSHAVTALKLGWFKLYYPSEFYAAVLENYTNYLPLGTIMKGKNAVDRKIAALLEKHERGGRETVEMMALPLISELMSRGIEILPADILRSDAVAYSIENGNLRLPLYAIRGCGENSAKRIKAAAALGCANVGEIQQKSGVSEKVIEALEQAGAFKSIK